MQDRGKRIEARRRILRKRVRRARAFSCTFLFVRFILGGVQLAYAEGQPSERWGYHCEDILTHRRDHPEAEMQATIDPDSLITISANPVVTGTIRNGTDLGIRVTAGDAPRDERRGENFRNQGKNPEWFTNNDPSTVWYGDTRQSRSRISISKTNDRWSALVGRIPEAPILRDGIYTIELYDHRYPMCDIVLARANLTVHLRPVESERLSKVDVASSTGMTTFTEAGDKFTLQYPKEFIERSQASRRPELGCEEFQPWVSIRKSLCLDYVGPPETCLLAAGIGVGSTEESEAQCMHGDDVYGGNGAVDTKGELVEIGRDRYYRHSAEYPSCEEPYDPPAFLCTLTVQAYTLYKDHRCFRIFLERQTEPTASCKGSKSFRVDRQMHDVMSSLRLPPH